MDYSGLHRINNYSLNAKLRTLKYQLKDSLEPETGDEDNSVILVQEVSQLARQHYFLKSKNINNEIIMIDWYNDLEYLNIEHWAMNIPTYFISNTFIQAQAANVEISKVSNLENDINVSKSLDTSIDKEFEIHKLKSKKRRKSLPTRFSFNTKNTENLAKSDSRTPYEIFESILKKLHQQYTSQEYELLCKSCNHDLSIPQVTENGIFIGSTFIKSLMKKYKRSSELCYGNSKKITKLLIELGYDKSQIYSLLENNEGGINSHIVPGRTNCWQKDKLFDQKQTQAKTDHIPGQLNTDNSKDTNLQGQMLISQSSNITSGTNYDSIFHILQGISKNELSNYNVDIYKNLSIFIYKNIDYFQLHNPVNLITFCSMAKVYFVTRRAYINRKVRKIIMKLFFDKLKSIDKQNTKCLKVKDYIETMFNAKGYKFNNQDVDILSQQALLRQGSVPYVSLNIENEKILFCLDTGSSHNLLTQKTYSSVKHLEHMSYTPPIGVSLRNITDVVSKNVIQIITILPIIINGKKYLVKFYVGRHFNRNFLGSDFIINTKASLIYKDSTESQILLINNKELNLEYLFLHEIEGNAAIMAVPEQKYKATPEQIIKDHISYSNVAFEIYGSEENLNKKAYEILQNYDCVDDDILQGNSANLELNYDNLDESEIFPSDEVNEYLKKRIYLPQVDHKKIDPFYFESDHMTKEQVSYLKNIINDHSEAVSTPEQPLGNYKLFQASIKFFPGKKSIQAKRQINYDLISEDIDRMVKLNIISENFSNDIDTLSNLVVVSKSSRLCKADKFLKQQEQPEGANKKIANNQELSSSGISKNPQHRLTIDLSDVNSILWGQKYINLSKHEELLENLTDCYLTKMDISEYFFCFGLDQISKRKVNFYYKN